MDHPSPCIPAADIERMTMLAHELVNRLDPHGPLLLRKLADADIRAGSRNHAPRASLDSFVTYRLSGEGREKRRLLIHPADRMWPPAELPISSPLGIALLGTAAGDRVQVPGSGTKDPPYVEVLKVEQVSTGGFVRRGSRGTVPSFADRT